MGLKCSLDIVQAAMENILAGIEDADVYIDNVGAFSSTWEHHLELLRTILRRLCENGFTINPFKCKCAVKKTDWLGYWLTPCSLKHWKKKIGTVLHMISLVPPLNSGGSLVALTITVICGLVMPRYYSLLLINPVLKKVHPSNRWMLINVHLTKCVTLWQRMLL